MSPTVPEILVVDDLPQNLMLLAETLRGRGFRVRPVADGEAALRVARSSPPDLILLDVMMPGLNGYQVCALLKDDPALRDIPVIFVSALDETVNKLAGFQVGAVDYVAKPFEGEEVIARVSAHLELARLRRELTAQNARLEQTVATRTRELAQANARLVLLDTAKSEFLQMISHELRTPLNGVFGSMDLLLEACDGLPEAAEYGPLYRESRGRLMGLIEDAQWLTEVGTRVVNVAVPTVAWEEALREAIRAAGPVLAQQRVRVGECPPGLGQARADSQHLVRALQSLLEITARFANPGTLIRVTAVSQPDRVGLRIEGYGKSVPADALPGFFALLASSRPVLAGVDLGLSAAVAERIVRLYGGTLTLQNLEPCGIAFDLSFPVGRGG